MKAILPDLAMDASARAQKLTYFEIPGPRPREFFLYRPSIEIPGAPILVSVHGIARNAAAHGFRFIEQAERYGLSVLAPLFTRRAYGQYQQLLDPDTGARADQALLSMLEAAGRLSGADVSRLLLFGFSGGAQFAHRFAMLHPQRIASLALASAGWYTFPTQRARYPFGADTSGLGFELDLNAFLDLPIQVSIGELDYVRNRTLRRTRYLDRKQGRTRIERAVNWVNALNRFAGKVQKGAFAPPLVLPSVGHSFIDSVERADLTAHVMNQFARDTGLTPVKQSA